jgi:NADH-quinone oxidoreductase subunit L
MRADIVDRIQLLGVLILLLPLLGVILNGVIGRRFPKNLVSVVSCGMPLVSFVLGFIAFRILTRLPDPVDRSIQIPLFTWLQSGGAGAALDIRLGLLFDPLSAILVMVITGVGFLIHVYSTGYMSADPGYRRYFTYLNLFLFCMLTLVLADSLPLLFVGWEGVGLCSYLLIGFWYEDPKKADAGKKAFIVNRVGDLGFLLGMLVYFGQFGTLGIAGADRQAVVGLLPSIDPSVVTAIGLLLFVGAVGKSAQIPLQIWLPDAMAGPTPVSALIHAATMVTAGVYLVARMNFLYAFSPVAGTVIASVGTATAIVAGLAAIAQRDIKRVLAYSTISQLGFMFMAVGLGAYAAGIFHLVTHAFFKALLFLGAGTVIHALHGEQDLFRMGGLIKPLRTVFWTMMAGVLALAGIFPFSGFWSKDEILLAAMERHQYVMWGVGLAAAVCTAFYSARLLALTFLGESRRTDPRDAEEGPASDAHRHARKPQELHRPSASMVFALVILALLSFFGGVLGLPPANPIEQFLRPVWLMPVSEDAAPEHVSFLSPGLLNAALAFILALLACALAWYLYTAGSSTMQRWAEKRTVGRAAHGLAGSGFGFDWLYERVVVRPLRVGAFLLWLVVDVVLVDMIGVHGPAGLVNRAGGFLRRLQTGFMNHYASVMALGMVFILGYLLNRMTNGGLIRWLGF